MLYLQVPAFVFALHLLFGAIQTESRGGQLSNYISYTGRKIKQSVIKEQYVLRSKIEYVARCSSSSFCLSVTWCSLGNLCLLTPAETFYFFENNMSLEPEESRETMSEDKYKVNLFKGPSGRYTLTFNQAKSHCEQLNTTIASPADVLYARSLGFNSWNCGWMSDGRKGYVVQEHHHAWRNGFTTGINNCDTFPRSDVFCKIPYSFSYNSA